MVNDVITRNERRSSCCMYLDITLPIFLMTLHLECVEVLGYILVFNSELTYEIEIG